MTRTENASSCSGPNGEQPLCRFMSDRGRLHERIDAAFTVLLDAAHGTDTEMTADAGFILDVVRDVAMALTGLDITFHHPEEVKP